MKRIIAAMAALVLSIGCYAQDMIVKKDGSIIQAKVFEVGTSEVKYKKWSNQDGPSYAIAKSDILAINYQNGEKDTFGDNGSLPSHELNSQQGPQFVERSVALNNPDVISKYNREITFKNQNKIGGRKIGKNIKNAIGVFAFSENSVLSNDDLEIVFAVSKCTSPATGMLGNVLYKNKEHLVFRYSITVKNKTNQVIYFDLANCSMSNSKTMHSHAFYNGETVSVSKTNTTGVGIGGGGLISSTGIGVGVGASSAATTTHTFSQDRIVAIPPQGMKTIRDFNLMKVKNERCEITLRGEELAFGYSIPLSSELWSGPWGGFEYQEHRLPISTIKSGEIIRYTFENSPLVLDYAFTYSNSADFNTYSSIKSHLYLKELMGWDAYGSFFYCEMLNVKWSNRICIDDLEGYNECTLLGPIKLSK